MATFLFWNLQGKDLKAPVAALCHEHAVDVLLLAESGLHPVNFLELVNAGGSQPYRFEAGSASARNRPLTYLSRLPEQDFRKVSDEPGVSVRSVVLPVGPDLLLAGVHLPGRVGYGRESGSTWAFRLARAVREAEAQVGHQRTVVVGDFNMNPFDDGMVGIDGMHAVMDRGIASRGFRTVQGQPSPFFYNPMWSRLGDGSPGPPGTHFFGDSGPVAYFWNTYDQVLVRPDLLPYFPDDKLRVLTTWTGGSLLDAQGRPDQGQHSDHLPLLFTLQTEITS